MLQSLRSLWRHRRFPSATLALRLALCFSLPPAFYAPRAYAQPTGVGATQLRLANQQGDADTAILTWVLANSGPLHGDTLTETMRVAFTITPAEGWWDKAGDGKLAWHEPPAGNVHLRIFVLDLQDGRLIQGLTVHATLIDANGNEQSAPADFGWYPLINAYGGNVPIVTDSNYILRVVIDEPHPHRLVSFGEHPANFAEFAPVPIALPASQPAAQDPAAQDSAARDTVAQNSAPLPALATAAAAAQESKLLKACNAALTASITALWRQSVDGAEKPAGDYFVAYALGYPGPALQLGGSNLHIKSLTGKEDVRLRLLVRDSRTGRIIPGLKLQASLVDADGTSHGPGEMSLNSHSWLTDYEGDTRISRKGLYTLRVHFDAPGFRRWGRQSDRLAAPADVEFEDLSLKPEKKD